MKSYTIIINNTVDYYYKYVGFSEFVESNLTTVSRKMKWLRNLDSI